MMIQLKKAQEPLFVFQIYAPDSSYRQDEKDEFLSLLQQQLNKLPRKSKKIMLGEKWVQTEQTHIQKTVVNMA